MGVYFRWLLRHIMVFATKHTNDTVFCPKDLVKQGLGPDALKKIIWCYRKKNVSLHSK